MAAKTRCFATVKALKRLNPELLCATLRKFPEYLKERRLKLPRVINEENVPYEEIRLACMSGGIPQELDDLLFLVCALGTTDGWGRIKAEARFQGLKLDFKPAGLTSADLAMKAWLHDWPRNRQLLELSYARAKIHSRSSYVYYVPMHAILPPSHHESDTISQPRTSTAAPHREPPKKQCLIRVIGRLQ